jgi:hypothetical protein
MNIYPAILAQVRQNPELLLQARETLARWEAKQLAPRHRIEEWRAILNNAIQSESGRRDLEALLLDDSDAARRKKNFAPFAGLLPRETRRKIISTCAYDH